jgi:hypothetical protein
LGYRVVEVQDEPVSTDQKPANSSKPPRRPWSPVGYGVVPIEEEQSANGYRVVQIGEERKLVKRRRRSSQGEAPEESFRRAPRPPAFWAVIAAGGICLVTLGTAVVAAALPMWPSGGWSPRLTSGPKPASVVGGGAVARPVGVRPQPAVLQVQIPEVVPPAPEQEPIEAVPAVVKDEGKCEGACELPTDRPETFGTSVQFVRNPLEAARKAAAEHKLTFLLHVSGNFEDNRFT